MQIKNCVALVTGSNRGIGREFVRALVAQGATKVYASARKPAGRTHDLVEAYPGKVEALLLDITDADEIRAAAARCSDINLLVNNAGINLKRAFIDAPDLSAARQEIETNYFGTLSVCRAFAPVLKANGGGAIINMLSILSLVNMPLLGSLSASKAALLSLTQGVRAELARQGTLVTGVMPWAVDTDMTSDFPGKKTPPADIAYAALTAVQNGTEDLYPDNVAARIAQGMSTDPKVVEREMAAYLPA
jgi:NAD(P)-dependent dehydrogenase (short-subunit alcohol dehydrogenase family)